MNNESQSNTKINDENADEFPLTTQFNFWLGRRHRAYYFVTGAVTACLVMWYVFIPSVLDQTRKSYDRIYLDQDSKISQQSRELMNLNSQIGTLRDTIDQLRYRGMKWGEYEVPLAPHTSYDPVRLAQSIYGNLISAFVISYKPGIPIVSLLIDTCQSTVSHGEADCYSYSDDIPSRLGNFSPFYVMNTKYYIRCSEILDTTAIIELYLSNP